MHLLLYNKNVIYYMLLDLLLFYLLNIQLKKFFDEAYAYSKMSSVAEKNLKFEAMRDIFSGKKKLIIAVGSAKEITSAVNF